MTDEASKPDFGIPTIIAAWERGDLEALAERAALERTDTTWNEFVSSTVELHRRGTVDLLAAARTSAGQISHFARRLYEQALPRINLDATALVALANSLVERSADEGLPYFIYDFTMDWAARDRVRVAFLLDAVRAGTAPRSLQIAVLQAGLRVDRAAYLAMIRELLNNGNIEDAKAAGFVLGTVEPATRKEMSLTRSSIWTALKNGLPERRLAAFDVALKLGTRAGADATIALDALDLIEPQSGPAERHAAAVALFLARGSLRDNAVTRFCNFLRGTEKGEKATIDVIDNVIADNLGRPGKESCMALLVDLLKRGVADLEQLDGTAHHIATEKGGFFEKLAAEWIADGDGLLIEAVCKLVSLPYSQRPIVLNLDFSGYALDADRTCASARMAIAGLTFQPVAAASILLCLMRSAPPQALSELEAMIFDPLLISYPDGPREYLDKAASGQPRAVQEILARVAARDDEYRAAIDAPDIIKEFFPSERRMFLRQLLRLEEWRAIEKNAQSKSMLADLFPKRVLLYGDSVVSDIHEPGGGTARREFKLASVKHSIPTPMLDLIDPVGFHYQRMRLSMGDKP